MENESSGKKQRFTKRRERAQVNQVLDEGSADDDAPSTKDKPRSKPRKKKNNANLAEEDIIDGFAIISFKSLQDLEKCVKATTKPSEKSDTNVSKEKKKSSIKKRIKKHRPLPLPSPWLRNSEESVEPSSSGEFTDNHKINSPRQSTDSRDLLSEASSSSGRGYLGCDSESADERASDASSDIFTLSHNRECLLPKTTVPSSNVLTTVVTTSSISNLVTTTTNTLASSTATTTSPTTTTSALSTASVNLESTKTTSSLTSPAVAATTSVITNGPNVASPSLKRKTLSPLPRVSPVPVKVTAVPKVPPKTSTPSLLSSGQSVPNDYRKVSPSPRATPKREEIREKEHNIGSFPKPWSSSSGAPSLFGPQVSLSPGLSIYHHPSFPQQPSHTASLSHSMFASPLPPGPSSNLGAGTSLSSPTDSMNIASQEILREELNRRFLLTQDRPSSSSLIQPSPYMRADVHQHQHMHQHQHQHTHQHMYPIVPPFSAGALVPTPSPLAGNKFGESPLYRNFGMTPGYPGLSPLIPPSGGLSSTLTGAFQPKRVSTGLHPSTMMHPLRERDKLPPTATLPQQKKPGKWNAVHVRVAWEIYQHQQKHLELQKGAEGKSIEPLRPPSHLFPGGSLHRPTDLSASATLLSQAASHNRNNLDSAPGHSSFLNPMHSGASPFPKPSPYSMANQLGFSGLGSVSGAFSGRDIAAVPGLTSPHEWNRLHRTPPTFPSMPGAPWGKREEGEGNERPDRGLESGVLALDRRREEERERERRNGEHERRISMDERSRERELSFMKEAHASRSRSRSRSPLQNGRVGSAKSDSSYERRFEDKGGLKIKQERRDEDLLLQAEREKQLRTDYLLGRGPPSTPLNLNMLERARLLGPSPYLLGDRVPPHPALLGHYDKSPLEMSMGQHRFQLQQDVERERERMFSRMGHPAAALFDQDLPLKEDLFLQEQRNKRDFLERFYDPQRLALEQSRYHPFRNPDPLSAHFPRTISPMIGHAKGGSPAGYPPPLVPSSSATQSRTQSPVIGRTKPSATETSDKRDNYSNSTDPSVHSR